MMKHKVAVIAGDGIGPEVLREGVKVLNAAAELDGGFRFEFTHFPWGCEYYLEHGRMMAEDGIEQLSKFAYQTTDAPFIYITKLESFSRIFMADLLELLLVQQTLSLPRMFIETSTIYSIDWFINTNHTGTHTRNELAAQLNVSPRHLDRILTERYGMTFQERLNMIRVKTAKDFLSTTDKKVSEIAELLGYNNTSHFCNFIKRKTGKTPSQIRNESKK